MAVIVVAVAMSSIVFAAPRPATPQPMRHDGVVKKVRHRGSEVVISSLLIARQTNPGTVCILDEHDSVEALAQPSTDERGTIRGVVLARVVDATIDRGDAVLWFDLPPDEGGSSLTVWSERCAGAIQVNGEMVGEGVVRTAVDPGRSHVGWAAPEGYGVAADIDVPATGCTLLVGGLTTRGLFDTLPDDAVGSRQPCEVIRSVVTFPTGSRAWSVLQGDRDVEPRLVERKSVPACPLDVRHAEAIVRFVVSPDGNALQSWPISTNHPVFAAQAAEAVRTWVFTPGLLAGQAVASMGDIELTCERASGPGAP
jgi:hypothetical protein